MLQVLVEVKLIVMCFSVNLANQTRSHGSFESWAVIGPLETTAKFL